MQQTIAQRQVKDKELQTLGPEIEKALEEKVSLRTGPSSSHSNRLSADLSTLDGW
jgi:hypothetical protein